MTGAMQTEVFNADTLGFAGALYGIGKRAEEFNDDRGRAIDKSEVAAGTVRKESAGGAKRLRSVTGYSFYMLGPVYAMSRIGFDITASFASTTGYAGRRIVVKLNKPVIDGIGEWGHVLEALPAADVAALKQFMDTQTALVATTGVYFRFEAYSVECVDPIGVDRNDIVHGVDDAANITVFVPSGNKVRYTVATPISYPLTLVAKPPRAHVILEGTAALQASKGEGLYAVDSKKIVTI